MRLHQIRPLLEANVVNPRDIDDWIENRISRVRRHYPETRKTLFPWLAKRVRQHVVGLSDQQAARMMQTVPGPGQSLDTLAGQYGDWIQAAHQRGETLFHFDWTLTSLMTPLQNAVIHVLDYIISLDAVATQPQDHEGSLQAEAARQLGKITRLTLEQAVTHADRWFEDLQAAGRQHAEKAETAGTKPVMEFADGFRWVQITDTRSLDREGDIMGHCVGGGSYDEDLQKDRCRIYSLRDPQNQPHVTIETRLWREWDDSEESYTDDDGTWVIEQIKGKQNEPPVAKYRPYVKAFLNRLQLDPSEYGVEDLEGMDLFRDAEQSRYGTLRELGHVVMSVGDLDLVDNPDRTFLNVMRGDHCLCRFGRVHGVTAGPLGSPSLLLIDKIVGGTRDSFPRQIAKPVFQALSEHGVHFYGDALNYLINSMFLPVRGELVDATEVPPDRELGPYRLIYLETGPQGHGYVWVRSKTDSLIALLKISRSGQGPGIVERDGMMPPPWECSAELAELVVSFLNDQGIRDTRTRQNQYDSLNNITKINPGGPFIARTDLRSFG